MSLAKIVRQLLWLTILCFFVFKNIASWHSAWFGLLVLTSYLLFVGAKTHALVVHWFTLSKKAWRVRLLAFFLAFIFLTWFTGFTIIFGWISILTITAGFWLNGLLFIILENVFVKKDEDQIEFDAHSILEVWEEAPSAKMGIILYIILFVLAVNNLLASHTDYAVLSPWQIIDKNYLTYFLLATLVLGYLLFTKIKVKFLLFFLVAHSLLLHAYLPATHTLFYGADQWRHLAAQNVLLAEHNLTPTQLRTDEAGNKFDLGRVSYMQYYSASIIFARLVQVDLLAFNKWFVPIVWSLILPLLLYEWGRTLGGDKKTALILAWLSFLPYTWQSSGSFSLPVNFGFLIWLLAILLWFRRQSDKKFVPTMAMLFFGALLFLSYIMYFLIFWLLIVVYVFATQTKKWKKVLGYIFNIVLVFIMGFIVPLAEIIFGYSGLPKTLPWFSSMVQFLGNFSGYYLASGPRPHDILNGNIIFNQTPTYAFVGQYLTYNRWWLVAVAVMIFGSIIYVAFKVEQEKENMEAMVTGRLLVTLFVGYFLGRYILVGEGVLSRRLDVVLAWGIISLLFVGWLKFASSKWWQKPLVKNITIIVLAAAISASYSLGPDTNTLSLDEYRASQYVWSEESAAKTHCVLADTYPLLGLEAASARQIIGGNFPINRYFAQPERVALFKAANQGGDWLFRSKQITKADHCWLITKMENLKIEPQEHFGHIGVYKF